MPMSAHDVFRDFFPGLEAAWQWAAPGLLSKAMGRPMPPDMTLQLWGQDFTLRMPFLIPFAALGALVGFSGYRRLSRGTQVLATQRLWAAAFLMFGLMNTSAVFVHCLVPYRKEALSAWRIWGALDIAFTGCSSMCLILACLTAQPKAPPAARWATRHQAALAAWLWLPYCAAAFAGHALPPTPLYGVGEVIYVATTLAACGALMLWEVLPALPRGGEEARWALRLGAWGSAVVGAAAFDGPLTAASRGHLGAAQLLFLCCDAAFYALARYLAAAQARLVAGGAGGGRAKRA